MEISIGTRMIRPLMKTLLDAWNEGPFVFISSVDVYGYPEWVPVTEDHPLDATYSDYAGGKVHCEALLRQVAGERGRDDFCILRPPHIWGRTRAATNGW